VLVAKNRFRLSKSVLRFEKGGLKPFHFIEKKRGKGANAGNESNIYHTMMKSATCKKSATKSRQNVIILPLHEHYRTATESTHHDPAGALPD
jgi:hypothetical protein